MQLNSVLCSSAPRCRPHSVNVSTESRLHWFSLGLSHPKLLKGQSHDVRKQIATAYLRSWYAVSNLAFTLGLGLSLPLTFSPFSILRPISLSLSAYKYLRRSAGCVVRHFTARGKPGYEDGRTVPPSLDQAFLLLEAWMGRGAPRVPCMPALCEREMSDAWGFRVTHT